MAAGAVVDSLGKGPLVEALVVALRARGGEIDRYTHRFHTYPARMHPDAARALLEVLAGDTVLDPFCGGGTLLVEAMVAGRRAIGRDIHPVATLVANARTRLLDEAGCQRLAAEGARIAGVARAMVSRERVPIPEPVYRLREWYDPRMLRELATLHALLGESDQRELLGAVHSSIAVKYSLRASDTSARREVRRYGSGAAVRAFRERAQEMSRMLGELRQAVAQGAPEAVVSSGDARELRLDPVPLVCTSPPYPATYDYVPLQELRLAWLEASGLPNRRNEAKDREIGARRRFRRSVDWGYEEWVRDTHRWTRAVAACLQHGGHLAVLIGDGISRGRLLEARRPSVEAAREAGLDVRAAVSIDRLDPGTQLAKREHALVFAKP